jgi:hypothetical protein
MGQKESMRRLFSVTPVREGGGLGQCASGKSGWMLIHFEGRGHRSH